MINLQIIETSEGKEDSLISFVRGERWEESEKRGGKTATLENIFCGIRLFQSNGRTK